MKRILIILLGLFSVAYGQFPPTSAKSAFKWGVSVGTRDSSAYAANDSLVVVINRQGRMMYRSTDGYWKILSNAAASDYVPYTGAVASVNLGEFRLSSRSIATDSILARSSAGGRIVSNSGTVIAEYGAGGGSNMDFHGFAGYNANRSSSYTARSFTDKNYVDSSVGLRKLVADTLFTTGYTTRARTKQVIDSLGAVKQNVLTNPVTGTGVSGQIAYWNGTNSVTGSSAFTWNNSLSSLGIRNSAAPLAPIHVGNRNVNNSVDAQILISREIDNTISGNGHGFSDASNFNRSGNAAYNSYDGRIDISGSNNYDHYIAFQHGPTYNGAGTIDFISGLYTIVINNSGTITNNYGVWARNPAGSGTIVNNYGVRIDDQTKGNLNYGLFSSVSSGTNKWNIYSNGTAPSYFNGFVGIGSVNNTRSNLYVTRPVTGATTSYSFWNAPVIQSDVTSSSSGFLNQLNTVNSTFTLPNYRHYHASQDAIGASSTVQTQAGFFADATIIGASVRNLGFSGDIPSGNGRYNSFMNGTARNFFRGNTLIGDTVLYAGSPNFSVTGKAYISDTLRGGTIARVGGTSSQFLKADGSVDANSYLSISDTSTMLNPYVTGTGTNNTIPKFNSTTRTLVNSNISDNASKVTIASNFDIYGNVSIGSAPDVTRSLNINQPLTGSTTGGIFQYGVVQPTASLAYGYHNNLSTAASSFNLGEYTHYYARQNPLGAGSSITNQNGFYVSSLLTGATFNYGFRGEIPSGTGRWNLFMNGSASNYLEGELLVGTSTSDGISKIRVNGIVSAEFRSSSSYRISAPASAWDRGLAFFGSSGTSRGGFGAVGSSDILTDYYIGKSGTEHAVRIRESDSLAIFNGSVLGFKGVTAQRGNFTSLRLNKDSVAITNTNVVGLRIDTVTGNITRQQLSGSYTPTITAVTNVDASTTNVCFWSRAGNMVTVTGYLEIDPTAANTATEFRLSLPITTSFTGGNSGKVAGTMAGLDGAASGSILADIAGNRASFRYTTPASTANMGLSFTFSYLLE